MAAEREGKEQSVVNQHETGEITAPENTHTHTRALNACMEVGAERGLYKSGELMVAAGTGMIE